MNIRNLWRRHRSIHQPVVSYAQSGEDCIVGYIMRNLLGIPYPTYLDIGAHHAQELSNTFSFYKQGCRGVCVEPNPHLHSALKQGRKHDICLNVGIARSAECQAKFYVIDPPTMSTFSQDECERYIQKGYVLKEIVEVPLTTIESLIPKYFNAHPNFVSLDTEGYDLAILAGWDFERFRPEVFCIETVEHVSEDKIPEFDEIMVKSRYVKYADTFVNTIYVDRDTFERRRR